VGTPATGPLLLGLPRPAQVAAPVAPAAAGAPPAGDLYERAVIRLACSGFAADVRRFQLSSEIEMRTVAVHLQAGDLRIRWSTNDSCAVPLGMHYRRESRRGCEFTVFSGAGTSEVQEFVNRLASGRSQRPASTIPSGEWDPHQMEEAERAHVESQLLRLELLEKAQHK